MRRPLSIEPGWPGLQRSKAPEGDKTRTPRARLQTQSLPEKLAGDSRWSSPGHPSPTFSDGRTRTSGLQPDSDGDSSVVVRERTSSLACRLSADSIGWL